MACSPDARDVEPQVLRDMMLLALDRGIDLIALGANPKERGPPNAARWPIG